MESEQQFTRFVWNVTPKSKVQQGKSGIPAAVHYTPMQSNDIPNLQYIPLTCECEAVFNPFSTVNMTTKTTNCLFCGKNRALPPTYVQGIQTHQTLPHEFLKANTTIQFSTCKMQSKGKVTRTAYIFLIDMCVVEKEMVALKKELVQVISKLPQKCNVGVITYNKHVHVYDLASVINTVYCLSAVKEYHSSAVLGRLETIAKNDPNYTANELGKRIVVPVAQYREQIIRRVMDIHHDHYVYVNERNHCAMGQALQIAVSIAEALQMQANVIMLAGGPCTIGPGKTIEPSYKAEMRSIDELDKGVNVDLFGPAKHFYDVLLKRVIRSKTVIHLFAFSLNQIGLTEMSELILSSGGFVVMHQQFSDRIFRQSFNKIFPQTDNKKKTIPQTDATLVVLCSSEIVLNGALGQCTPLPKTKPCVSEKVIGKGGTNAWYLGGVDMRKMITVVYETKEQTALTPCFYMQFKLIYRNEAGDYVTRVTTVMSHFETHFQSIQTGFDSEAAIVLFGRMCVQKALFEEQRNIKQWVDKCICKWTQTYANYIKGDINSFTLPPSMKLFPQLVFNLRRSIFISRFGCSLDQSLYFGYHLNRQCISNCIAMIQPTLLSYSLQTMEPCAVNLDEEEMKEDVILLLDSYFVVIEWYGEHVQSWFEQGFHQQKEYAHIAEFMNSTRGDIEYFMQNRMPVSNYYRVHPGHSKERYLKSKVNPKKETNGNSNENMLTDQSDLRGFTQQLMRIVVNLI